MKCTTQRIRNAQVKSSNLFPGSICGLNPTDRATLATGWSGRVVTRSSFGGVYRERMRARRIVTLMATIATAMSPFADGLRAGATAKVASFEPVSVSFSSAKQGWVLGTLSCAKDRRCLAMLETVNAGQSWFNAHLPAPLVNVINHWDNDTSISQGSLRESKRRLGLWTRTRHHPPGRPDVSGFKTVLWATHDGGTRWARQMSPGDKQQGTIYDLEASRTMVYVLAPTKSDSAEVESSPVGENEWEEANHVALNGPAGGAQPSGSMVLEGSTGWLIFGNDRGTTGSAQLSSHDTWVAWRSPCAGVGHGYAVPAAANARDLVAVCGMGGFAYPMPTSAPRGATIGSSWLYFSTNGGASFTACGEIPTR